MIDPDKFEILAEEMQDEFKNVLMPMLESLGWGVPDAEPEDMA
jgi:hypothetical protein